VALGSQLRERRRAVHAAVARAIEQQHADHIDEHAALLAHHCEEADDARAAVLWHRRAAEWVGLTDLASSAYHWGRVRELVRGLPNDRELVDSGIAACTQLMNSIRQFGAGLDEARVLLEEGQTLADAMGDRRAHLEVSMAYSRTHVTDGNVGEYLKVAADNHRAALEIDDLGVQANASFYLGDALGFAARFSESLEMADDALVRFPRRLPKEEWTGAVNPYWVFSILRSLSLAWLGRLPEALEGFDRTRRLADEDDTLEETGYTVFRTTEAWYLIGDANQTLAGARQMEEAAQKLGEPLNMAALTPLCFTYAHLAAGRPADAIEQARTALTRFGNVERAFEADAATWLAEALLAAGDVEAAETGAEQAIAFCRRSSRANLEAIAHGILARARLRRHGAAARDDAESSLAEVAVLIERTGATTIVPMLCEWRAELAAVLGDDATRAALLRDAQNGYLEIGAPKHAERIGQELTP
jgi:tetratricopeptide (TPR) repeat protein